MKSKIKVKLPCYSSTRLYVMQHYVHTLMVNFNLPILLSQVFVFLFEWRKWFQLSHVRVCSLEMAHYFSAPNRTAFKWQSIIWLDDLSLFFGCAFFGKMLLRTLSVDKQLIKLNQSGFRYAHYYRIYTPKSRRYCNLI